MNRCGGREGACELPIKGGKIHRGGYFSRSPGVVIFQRQDPQGWFFSKVRSTGVVIFHRKDQQELLFFKGKIYRGGYFSIPGLLKVKAFGLSL